MATMAKRATVYFDPEMEKALKIKAAATSRSLSDLVNDAVRLAMAEDAADLAAFEERRDEPVLSCEDVLKDLKQRGLL
jgi:hypothetical protein